MSHHCPSPSLSRSVQRLAFLVFAIALSGCGLTGSKELADSDASGTDIEILAEQDTQEALDELAAAGPRDNSAEQNHVTQRALGRMPDGITLDMPPMTLARVMPASTRANLLQKPETPEALPIPEPSSNQRPAQATPIAPQPPQPMASGTLDPPATPAPRRVEKVGAEDFEKVVLESDVPVIVDFYADWCKPCKRVAPILDEIAQQQAGLRVVKVNIDHDEKLARQYRIQSIPTVMVFREGKLIAQHTGLPNIQKALRRDRP